jgi:hypothetical protein
LQNAGGWVSSSIVKVRCQWLVVALAVGSGCGPALAQIDPVSRNLFQFGYNGALEGHPPLAAYAFYYRNEPGFLRTNLTLRLAVAPTYLDSELGIREALGPQTDLGIGVAGGGFADGYAEIRRGTYLPSESFDGYGADVNLSLYHLFNPGQMIPLNGLLRGIAHYSTYARRSDTAADFQVPDAMGTFSVRTGLRWGGREPILYPALAMELSVWYQGEFRTSDEVYGFGDRKIEPQSHLFWTEALLAYTLPELHHSFYISLTAGTSINADRLSAYRLGALLPMVSEFPLSLPGYYYQEISATDFVLVGANYILPLDKNQHWNLTATAITAFVDYLAGLEQPGHQHTGVGGGLFYTSPNWRVMIGYGYGVDAIRSSGRGAQSIGLLLQLDLDHAKEAFYKPEPASRWRGFQRILGVFGN